MALSRTCLLDRAAIHAAASVHDKDELQMGGGSRLGEVREPTVGRKQHQ